jgi:hypothetical protein
MKLFKAILRQGVDLIFLAVTLGFFISFLYNWDDAGFWLGACVIYVTGSTLNKANLSIWLEDNHLVK